MDKSFYFFLIFAGIFGLVNLFKKFSNQSPPPQDNPPFSPPSAEPTEFSPELPVDQRRFREALGLPVEMPLPPQIPRKKQPVPLQVKPESLPPLPSVTFRKVEPTPFSFPQNTPPPKWEAPKQEKIEYAITRHPSDRRSANTSLKRMLHSKDGLKESMILREVLGTPKGLEGLPGTL